MQWTTQNKIALTNQSYIHNSKYLENTEYFDINSNQNILNMTAKCEYK